MQDCLCQLSSQTLIPAIRSWQSWRILNTFPFVLFSCSIHSPTGPTKSDAKITEPTDPRHWNAANHPHCRSTNHTIVAMFWGTNETETRKQYDFQPIRSSSAMIRRAAVWIGFWRVSPTASSEEGGIWNLKSREFRFHKFVRILISQVGIWIPRTF